MKFLCIKCDSAMALGSSTFHEDIRSHSVVYRCASCGNEIAMLTNAHESQLVASLGVKIGPDGEKIPSKCPFTNMVSGTSEKVSKAESPGIRWSADAVARLEKIPEFMRPMAKNGIEQFALERGIAEISPETLNLARSHFGV